MYMQTLEGCRDNTHTRDRIVRVVVAHTSQAMVTGMAELTGQNKADICDRVVL